jgi:ribosomal protein S3
VFRTPIGTVGKDVLADRILAALQQDGYLRSNLDHQHANQMVAGAVGIELEEGSGRAHVADVARQVVHALRMTGVMSS